MGDQPGSLQIHNFPANGHADTPGRIAGLLEAAKGQVLDGEISGWVIGRFNPALQIR